MKAYPSNLPVRVGWYKIRIADMQGNEVREINGFWLPAGIDDEQRWRFSSDGYSQRCYDVVAFEPLIIHRIKEAEVKQLKNNQQVETYCPECKPLVKLIVKTNRHNGNQFLGCPNYPECRYTREIPEEIRMREAGQKGLFDNGGREVSDE